MYSMDYRDLISEIAISIFNSVGPGFEKEVYQNALKISLKKNNLVLESKLIPINYENQTIGTLTVDVVQYRVVILIDAGYNLNVDEYIAKCTNAKRIAQIPYGIVCLFPTTLQNDLIVRIV